MTHLLRSLSVSVLLAACASTPLAGERSAEPVRATGRVTYDARQPTTQGTSEAVEVRPGRHLDLALVDAAGVVLVEGQTDAEGGFELEGPPSARAVRVFARVQVEGHDAAIANDTNGRETHAWDVPIGDGEPLAIHADDRSGHAGALHVVDTMLRGLRAVTEWTGRELPPVFVYWMRGGTREWSFYRGERPAESGRFALELLGGEPGQASTTDTDEHDEAIILHELGHFVMDRLTRDSSTGGMHPTGCRVDPGLAWEEGRATWFALSVLRAPLYQDTIGVQPWGSLRVDADLEANPDEHDVSGLASETSVSRVLWDLSDGAGGLPDADEDGIALGPGPILLAMIGLAERPETYGSLPALLRHMVREGVVEGPALQAMLTRTEQPHAELLPPDDTPLWPRVATIGETITGTVDGLTQPAPSGGPNLPVTGIDAIHTFQVRVEEPGMLVLRLYIEGTGSPQDHTDLELELLDLRADRLESSTGTGPEEHVAHLVHPGTYIVRVRDSGTGNRAAYRLRVLQETLGGPPIR